MLASEKCLLISNLLIPISLIVFATGFFPYKPFLPGLAQHKDGGHGPLTPAPFDKLIFMVVDALRRSVTHKIISTAQFGVLSECSDFVFDNPSGFTFTQRLIANGSALPFTANAQAPTVTMPRIKALTTGSVPSFLDMILNFAESDTTSTLAEQDTWLAQIKARNGSQLIFYGDDTWLKLFPNMFVRSEGTSSFFVSDFYEVDNNVTRHIPRELEKADWSAMIVHYLGLDHIGHKSGVNSPRMIPKQMEMDDIVRIIYSAMETNSHLQSTLLVLCGDHGMRDAGGHGGSAPGETSPALVLASPKFSGKFPAKPCPVKPTKDYEYYQRLDQSDVAASLSTLLGLPTSRNNLGVVSSSVLPLWENEEAQTNVLLQNALQILDIVRISYPSIDFDRIDRNIDCAGQVIDGDRLWCLWKNISAQLDVSQTQSPAISLTSLFNFCYEAQRILSSAASAYDLSRMLFGTVIAATALCLAIMPFLDRPSIILSVSGVFFLIATSMYALLFFASSYVEEEQQYWYWLSSAWIQLQILRKGSSRWKSITMLLAVQRFVHRFNQSGQKFSGAPDIATAFFPHHPLLLWLIISMTYGEQCVSIYYSFLRSTRMPKLASCTLALSIVASSLLFKLSFTQQDEPHLLNLSWLPQNLVPLARINFLLIFSTLAYLIFCTLFDKANLYNQRQMSVAPILLTFLTTQTKATNIPLHLLICVQHSVLNTLNLSEVSKFTGTFLLAQAVFFAFGNTNSISSIDLSQAYNGLNDFSLFFTGVLLVVATFAGPFAHICASRRFRENGYKPRPTTYRERDGTLSDRGHRIALATFSMAGAVLGIEFACFWLREHLFVWTVFSPKYLYVAAWWASWHLLGVVGLDGIV